MELGERRRDTFFPGKSMDMFQHIADLTEHQSSLAHVAFKITLAEIFLQSRVDLRLVLDDAVF